MLKLLPALLLSAALVAAPSAHAQGESPDARTVTLSYRGPLRDALKAIASQSGVNLVATGGLDTEVELHLKGVSGEQALRTIARAYALELDEEDGVWTMTPTEDTPGAAAHVARAPVPPALPALPEAPEAPAAPVPPEPPAVASREARDVAIHGRSHTVRKDETAKDVVVYGGNLTVDGHVLRDAAVFGGNMVVNGHVEKDAVAVGGNLVVNGHVEGDAHAFGGNVKLGPGAVVDGDVSSFGGRVDREEGSRVGGSRQAFSAPVPPPMRMHINHDREHDDGGSFSEWLGTFVMQFVVLFGLGFLFMMFAPSRMKQLGQDMKVAPVACGLTGFLALLALVPLVLLLCVTLVGIPVALALLLLVPLGVAMGFTALASELGMRLPLMRGRKTQAVVLALGTLALLVVFNIPVIGGLTMAAIILVSAGALVRTRFGSRPKGMPEPVQTVAAPL